MYQDFDRGLVRERTAQMRKEVEHNRLDASLVRAARSHGEALPAGVGSLGAVEVPGSGDPDGTGFAAVTVNPGQGLVCYELSVSGIAPATGAHIHEAPFGEAGDVVVGLKPPTDGSSSGCVDVGRTLAKEILQDPADYYVNVHNKEYEAGALRGQLSK